MPEHTAPAEANSALGKLRADFPSWNIWTSHAGTPDGGAFYATRRGPSPSQEAQEMGLACTVGADDADALRGLLDGQSDLENQHEAAAAADGLEGLR